MVDSINDVQGKWLSKAVPALPETYSVTVESVSNVLEYTTQMLEVAVATLEVARAFTTANIDPLAGLAETVVSEIAAYLESIQQIGLYIHGDWQIIEQKGIQGLQGGYTAYERRMLTRLLDQSDLNRPDIPNTTQVLAAFFYAGVPYSDVNTVHELVRYVQGLMGWFGQRPNNPTSAIPTPVGLHVAYGSASTVEGEFGSLYDAYGLEPEAPTQVELTWGLENPHGTRAPIVVPGGFLVEVSVLKEGLDIYYDRPKANAGTVTPKRGAADEKVQPRERGKLLDPYGKPLVLFGGADQIDAVPYNSTLDSQGRIKPGYTRVYGVAKGADGAVYPLNMLKNGSDVYFMQRTFYFPAGGTQGTPGGTYRATIDYKDLPYPVTSATHGTTGQVTFTTMPRPAAYFWRVVPVLDPIASPTDLRYVLRDELLFGKNPRTAYNKVSAKEDSRGVRGTPSVMSTFDHITPNEADYYELVTAALAVLVLSRCDLSIHPIGDWEEGTPGDPHPDYQLGHVRDYTGLEVVARELVPAILGQNPGDYFDNTLWQPETFRSDLLEKCKNFALEMAKYSKPTSKQRLAVLESAKVLMTWKWSDAADAGGGNYNTLHGMEFFPPLTIVESLRDGAVGSGVSQSAYGISPTDLWASYLLGYSRVWGPRGPGFYARTDAGGNETQGSSDMSPVIYGSSSTTGVLDPKTAKVLFCRNVLTPEIYLAASLVLQRAIPPGGMGSGWVALRPMGWMPDLSDGLETLVEQVRHGLAITTAKSDAVDRAIQLAESKILQLTQLLQRIRGLLARTVTLQFDIGSVLVVVGDGTDGIIGGLTTAQNKPSDSPLDFGAGVVVCAGAGVPVSVLQQFFLAAN